MDKLHGEYKIAIAELKESISKTKMYHILIVMLKLTRLIAIKTEKDC